MGFTSHCRRFCFWLLAAIALALLLISARPVMAQSPTPGATPSPATTPTPTATVTPGVTITENIFHIIRFPFETMTEAVVKMGNKLIGQAYKDAQWIYGDTLGLLIFGDYGIAPTALAEGDSSTPLFAQIIRPHWNVLFTLALALLPVTLALTAVETLRAGTTSVLGFADFKEALLGWFVSAGAAAASFYLLGLAHRLSLSASQAILLADFGERVSGPVLALAFFNTAAFAVLANLIPGAPIALLYIGFFVLFLASSIIFGLALALAAYTALVYVFSALAPLVIVLGVVRPLRWLQALWLRSVTLVFLLPVADALLLKAAVSLAQSFYDPNGSGASLSSFLAGLFVTGGVLSVLIALNFKVGEMVFGALGEIHQRAWGATTGVVQLAATALGFVAGGIGVAAGGAALAGAGAASSSAAIESTAGVGLASETSSATGSSTTLMGNHSGLAQRLTGLLSNTSSSESAPQPAAADDNQSGENLTTDAEHSAAYDRMAQPESGDGLQRVSAPNVSPQEMKHRSRLAEGFGRALAMTGNPTLRGMGAGLQMAGAVGNFVADDWQAEQRATATPSDTQLVNQALRWSNQNLSHVPNDLFDPGRDNTALMAGALHQALLNDPEHGCAAPMGEVLNAVRASYGEWQAQGQPGGLAAQRAYFEAVADPENAVSPGRLTGAIVQWAEQNQVHLNDNWASAVKTVFDRSQPITE